MTTLRFINTLGQLYSRRALGYKRYKTEDRPSASYTIWVRHVVHHTKPILKTPLYHHIPVITHSTYKSPVVEQLEGKGYK